MSILDQLRNMTIVVADTGDIDAVSRLKPQDCTTNPSIVLKALTSGKFETLVSGTIGKMKQNGSPKSIAQALTVAVGAELAKIVPGRVSTEVDARHSFDTDSSIEKARQIVDAYGDKGIGRDRILIKLAATWEGIRAAEVLQKDGIDCNLTLLFSMAQAKASADAGAFLISPFVGRITDWYKKIYGVESYAPNADPGVQSVRRIHDYYNSSGIDTVVMGASFRNIDQVIALAGCDRLTIAPNLLDELDAADGTLERRLNRTVSTGHVSKMLETEFRWELNDDAMATEKLSEGIRGFNSDGEKLLQLIAKRLQR